MTKEQNPQKKMAALVRGAYAGKEPWLNDIIIAAGYHRNIRDGLIVRKVLDVADFFGVHRKTITRWKSEGMPTEPKGRYSIANIATWLIKRRVSEGVGAKKKTEIELEKLTHECGLQRIKLQEQEGKLVFRDDVHRAWAQHIVSCSKQIQGIPAMVMASVAPDDRSRIMAIVTPIIDGVLSQLADSNAEGPGSDDENQNETDYAGSDNPGTPMATQTAD